MAIVRRAFLAALPDAAARLQLSELQARLRPQHLGLRWIDAVDLHLTLRFLGDIDPGRARAFEPLLDAWSAGGPIELSGAAIEDWHGRVLVATFATTPVLERLVRSIEQAVRAMGFPAETRAFRAHATLARGRAGIQPRTALPDSVAPLRCDRIGLLARAEAESTARRYRELSEPRWVGTSG